MMAWIKTKELNELYSRISTLFSAVRHLSRSTGIEIDHLMDMGSPYVNRNETHEGMINELQKNIKCLEEYLEIYYRTKETVPARYIKKRRSDGK